MPSGTVNGSSPNRAGFLSPYQNLLSLYDQSKTIEEKRSNLDALPDAVREEIAYRMGQSEENSPNNPTSSDGYWTFLSSDSLPRLAQVVREVTSELFQSLPEERKDQLERCRRTLRRHIEKTQKPEERIAVLLEDFDQKLDEALEFERTGCYEKLMRMREKLLEEQKMIQANEKIMATHAEPRVLAEKILPDDAAALHIKGPLSPIVNDCKKNNPSIRENVITFIYERLTNCYPEDQVNVCAILYAKFKCSEEEKTCVALLLKESPYAQDVSGLTSKQIPNYSEAPEAEKRAADAYLSYATQRLFHQFMQNLLESPPQVPKTALRSTDFSEDSLSYISNLYHDQDPATKDSILILQSLHDCFGDLAPEAEAF